MDEMDKLLDSALQAYGEQEAPLGMERRVLRRVFETRPRRRWWLALVPVTGIAAFVVMSYWRVPEVSLPRGRGSEAVAQERAVVSERPATAPRPVEAQAAVKRGAARMPLVAPPEEPTAQQLALRALARDYREQAVEAMREPSAQITIEPLKVEPLQISELGDN